MKKIFFLCLFTFMSCICMAQTRLYQDKKLFVNENLRLRAEESTSSDIITSMRIGSWVEIREIGNEDTIDDITSKWVKIKVISAEDKDGVEIKKDTVGWCFAGYLTEETPIIEYPLTKDPFVWTLEEQKKYYDRLFKENKIDEIFEFRRFIDSLDIYHHCEPVYVYNPVFLCIDSYPEYLDVLVKEDKDMFRRGNMSYGDYQQSPFIYVVCHKKLKVLKWFYEHGLQYSSDNDLYGTRTAGGTRFGLGGSSLLYTNDQLKINYMLSKGAKRTVDIYGKPKCFLTKDGLNVYVDYGYKNPIFFTLNKDDEFTVKKITTYKIDGAQWILVEHNGDEGWFPYTKDSGFDYDYGW